MSKDLEKMLLALGRWVMLIAFLLFIIELQLCGIVFWLTTRAQ